MTDLFVIVSSLLFGILAGTVVAYLIFKNNSKLSYEKGKSDAGIEKAALQERINGHEIRLSEQKQESSRKDERIESLTSQLASMQGKNSALQTALEKERSQFNEKISLLNNAKEELSAHFSKLSIDIFESRNKVFSQQTNTTLEHLLRPFREQIDGFKKQLESAREQDLQERTTLKTEIQQLAKLNQQITEEAGNLTKALKGEIKTQGTWGEMILEKVLEKSGLVRGREFEIQESLKTADGKRSQPDVIVHLPEERDIVIDSKVSLVAYDRLVSSEAETEKTQSEKELVISIRNHIRALSEKDYHKLLGINSLDFVFMFIPIEGAFSAAIQADNAIFTDAFEKNIIMTSPSTLFALLRTINNIWKYENQTRNAREIAKRAGALYDKFIGFAADLENVGKGIDNARKSYDSAFNKLSTGKGNLVRLSENLKQLGADTTKKLPDSFSLDDGEEDSKGS
ncbi:MAG: DNA recombination protein RmuC [Spirochaetes bacterium]|nr:DNA recombination protein RmuC [Spirochaetota bacterium]